MTWKAINKLRSDPDKLAHDAVQYLRALLLIDDRIKIERSVIRRTPTHWMAKPTFEFINRDLVGMTSLPWKSGRKASGR